MWPLIIFIVICFGLGAALGAPYLPTRSRQAATALDLLGVESGDTVVDIGAGYGRFLRRAAQRGIKGIGYEINPILWLMGKIYLWPYRDLVTIKLGNFWNRSIPEADGVYVFLIRRYMERLDKKLTKEIETPTPVASFAFEIPGKEAIAEENGIFLYRYGGR